MGILSSKMKKCFETPRKGPLFGSFSSKICQPPKNKSCSGGDLYRRNVSLTVEIKVSVCNKPEFLAG